MFSGFFRPEEAVRLCSKFSIPKCYNIQKYYTPVNSTTFILYTLLYMSGIAIYRSIILPLVLYGCETWSLTLREERKMKVFENMVSRRTFGPRRDEVTGE